MPPVQPEGNGSTTLTPAVGSLHARRYSPALWTPTATSAPPPAVAGLPAYVQRPRARLKGRVEVDGKFFRCDDQRFPFHAVSYGSFAPRARDGAQFPDSATLASDLEAMAAAGFTVLRTYTAPPDDLLEAAR